MNKPSQSHTFPSFPGCTFQLLDLIAKLLIFLLQKFQIPHLKAVLINQFGMFLFIGQYIFIDLFYFFLEIVDFPSNH